MSKSKPRIDPAKFKPTVVAANNEIKPEEHPEWVLGRIVSNIGALSLSGSNPALTGSDIQFDSFYSPHAFVYAAESENVVAKALRNARRMSQSSKKPNYQSMRTALTIEYSRVKNKRVDATTLDMYLTFASDQIQPLGLERKTLRGAVGLVPGMVPQFWLLVGRLTSKSLDKVNMVTAATSEIASQLPETLEMPPVDYFLVTPSATKQSS